jgi:hypothetical protein
LGQFGLDSLGKRMQLPCDSLTVHRPEVVNGPVEITCGFAAQLDVRECEFRRRVSRSHPPKATE